MNRNVVTLSRPARVARFTSTVIAALAWLHCAHVRCQAITVSNQWSIATTELRSYVTSTTDTERGVAFNPFATHAYIVSRNGTLKVAIVDSETGLDDGTLSVAGISGGTFALNQIGVADDGNIYAANLTTASGSPTSPFTIYRWSSEGAAPVAVFSGNPTAAAGGASIRFGDAIDVRGSGTNTEIIASTGGANATNIVAIFRPTDDTLSSFTAKIILIGGVGLADFAKGVGFGPTNTFIGKNSGNSSLRFCKYDYNAGTASVLATYTVSSALTAVNMDPVNNLIAGVATANATSPHQLIVYDLSSGSPTILYTNNFPPPATASANVVGGIDVYAGHIVAVDAKNGVQMAKIYVNTNPIPPSVVSPPPPTTIVQGGYGSMGIGATGTKPLSYRWYLGNTPVDGATNNIITFTNLLLSSAGNYTVVISNSVGAITSAPVTLTVTPSALTPVLTPIWQIAPGAVPWMANDNNQRGIAYNPAGNHLIVVSRTPTNGIYVLDADTGAFLYTMNVSGISGGTFAMNMVAASEDGEVFVANLTTDGTTTPFKIYSYFSDDVSTAPVVVYSGDPGAGTANRWGDNFDVRFTGAGVQAIAGCRNNRAVAIWDDVSITPVAAPHLLNVANADAGNFGLSVTFGEGNTFWGKSAGAALRQVQYDDAFTTAAVVRTITNYPAMDVVVCDRGNQWIGGISVETPDNVRLLNIDTTPGEPFEEDTEFFPTDNANANGTGQVRFGPNRVFALDSNNGLIAMRLWPKLHRAMSGNSMTLTWDGFHTLQASPNGNTWTNVTGAVSGYSVNVTTAPELLYRLNN